MTDLSPAPAPPMPGRRLDLIDVARGVALAAMIVFHSAWDLSIFHVIATEVSRHAGWQWFARGIAGSFLFLSGVSLVLAHGKGFRRESFLRRLALVAGGAALVTLGTWYMFPDAFVYFGILHHIALAGILALPFLRLPAFVTLAAAALVLALPHFLSVPALETRWLAWIGLSETVYRSVDFVPLFPWFGCVLAGVAAARFSSGALDRLSWRAEGPLWSKVAFAGRHSLLAYVVHQPVLIPIAWLLAKLVIPAPAAALGQFEADCLAACTGQGRPAEVCGPPCACTRAAVERDAELTAAIQADRLNQLMTLRLTEMSRICARDPSARP